jgi:hypothetical protein
VSGEGKFEDRLLAIFLDHDDLLTYGGILASYKRAYDRSGSEIELVKRAIWQLQKAEVLIEYDVEGDMLSTASVDHTEHGQLATGDLFYVGVEELWAMGPQFAVRILERASEIAEQAIEGGLNDAVGRIRALPVDSRRWTGLSPDFVFDEKMKEKVLILLRQADDEIGRLTANNADVSQARALIKAARVLAEAPKPETEIVWTIIQRLADLIGIAQGVQGLVSLFRGLR